jgi:hypothetical protein
VNSLGTKGQTVDNAKEQQLWEVQRVVTQLKRQLRSFPQKDEQVILKEQSKADENENLPDKRIYLLVISIVR